jgi:hypothetical protein
MDMLNVKESLEKLVNDIFSKGKSFYGKPLSNSLKSLVIVEGDKDKGRVLVPYWFDVVQRGRGKRKTNKGDFFSFKGRELSTFQIAIYNWMEKNGRFESRTENGKINEAKGLAWYINKFGTKHYRSGQYIDIYDTLVKELAEDMRKQYMEEAMKITSDLVKLK